MRMLLVIASAVPVARFADFPMQRGRSIKKGNPVGQQGFLYASSVSPVDGTVILCVKPASGHGVRGLFAGAISCRVGDADCRLLRHRQSVGPRDVDFLHHRHLGHHVRQRLRHRVGHHGLGRHRERYVRRT